MTDKKTDTFDADELLKGSIDDVIAGIGTLSLDQLEVVYEAEKRGKKRSTLLPALKSELDQRLLQEGPQRSLSPDGNARVMAALHEVISVMAPLVPDEAAQAAIGEAVANQIGLIVWEREESARAANPPVTNEPAIAADKHPEKRDAAKRLKDAAALAFCDDGDTVWFKLDCAPHEFRLQGRQAILKREVELRPDKKRVSVSQVRLLDENGLVIATARWSTPLVGGGGKRGLFQRGRIGFGL